ncbi:hypothetical protein D3C75_824690 [compost metagenome]
MIRVMLSLDLIDAEDKRADFYGYLTNDGWKKAKNVDTVWLKRFSDYTALDEEQVKKLRNEIAAPIIEAYKKLKLHKVFYVAQIGNNCVISRVVEKRDGKTAAYSESVF